MEWNNALEQKKFEKKIERQEAWYRKEGMDESAIKEMTAFDRAWFNSTRREYEHVQPLESFACDVREDGLNPLIRRFPDSLVTYIEPTQEDIYWWIDEIEDPALLKAIRCMDYMTVTVLSLVVFGGYKPEEAAELLGITARTVYKYIRTNAKEICIEFGFVPEVGDYYEGL